MDTGIGSGDTTFLKKLMWVKMDIGYPICIGYGYVGQNGVFDRSETTYQKKKKKVDRSETLLWMVVRSSIYFYGLVRESTLHFQMNCEMHWRDMISVGHPSASQFFWVDGF